MSVLVPLLFFLSFTSVVSANHDENVLLQFKRQLGDPDFLSSWAPGFNFCNMSFSPAPYVFVSCDYNTGLVDGLFMEIDELTAPFPDAICNLTKLEFLYIYSMPGLYGQLPWCLTQLSNLGQLSISNTSLSGPVPSFYNNKNLIKIILDHNHLSGEIPSSLSTLPNLRELDLSFNFLTGTIPAGLVHGTNTYYGIILRLNNNNLTGELPKCYGFVDILFINVGNNRLRGDPSFLFSLNSTWIVLANNEFEFDLSFVEFSYYLVSLDISHNKIYGNVPYSFATAPRLTDADLSFNKLCGQLPQVETMGRFNAAVFANNTCLCGSPLLPCFNSAPAAAPSTPPF